MAIIECIPNFSEGRNAKIIQEIVAAIRHVPHIQLLGVQMGASANRTVVTFAGEPEAVGEGAFRAIQRAAELIDMQQHTGTHPRMGATDVCPFVPISDYSMTQTIALSHRIAQRVGSELHIPIFCYEHSALRPNRKKLEQIRIGQYEALAEKATQATWQPDFGDWTRWQQTGATVMGARDFLVAYNFNLDTQDMSIAKKIAADIRESGKIIDQNGLKIRQDGLCKGVKAIGWYMPEYGRAQVSTNITNLELSPVHTVFEAVRQVAQAHGTKITGAELIGLAPLRVFRETAQYLGKEALTEAEQVRLAIDFLGLADLTDFDPQQKIIEYALANT